MLLILLLLLHKTSTIFIFLFTNLALFSCLGIIPSGLYKGKNEKNYFFLLSILLGVFRKQEIETYIFIIIKTFINLMGSKSIKVRELFLQKRPI